MSEEKLFEEYLNEKSGTKAFLKTPKGWLIIFSIILGVVLAAFFYKTAVLDVMSREEVRDSIQVVWQQTQWMDKQATPQEVKIVPSIRVKIKNIGKRPLQYLDLEAVFVFEDTGATFDEGMVRLFKEPLMPGETSDEILVKSAYGYSASSKAAFLENKAEWKVMEAKLFARSKGSPLVRIGEIYPVRQIIEGFNLEAGEVEKPTEYEDKATNELAQAVQVSSQDSLWIDKIETANAVIIVPSITLEIKNLGENPLEDLIFKGVFMYEETGEVLSEGVTPALKDPLPKDQISQPISIKADFGYSASSKEAFFHNNEKWKRLKVRVYAKSKDSNYALLGTYPIQQKIQGIKVVYR